MPAIALETLRLFGSLIQEKTWVLKIENFE